MNYNNTQAHSSTGIKQRLISALAGSSTLSTPLVEKWIKPVTKSVLLPAHAVTTSFALSPSLTDDGVFGCR